MSHQIAIPVDLGTAALTLKAALFDGTTIHATIRDIAVTEVGQGHYIWNYASFPDGYYGAAYFYTGTLAAASDFSGVTLQAVVSINPEETEPNQPVTLAADSVTSTALATSAVNEIAAALSGTGARSVTLTVTDGTDPLQSALVRLTDNSTNSWTKTTNASGVATFSLDDGNYTATVTKGGYTHTPETVTVSGTTTDTLVMTAVTLATPSDPSLCMLYGTLYQPDGTKASNVKILATLVTPENKAVTAGGIIVGRAAESTSDANGAFELELIRTDQIDTTGCTWTITCEDAELNKRNVTLAVSTKDIADLV